MIDVLLSLYFAVAALGTPVAMRRRYWRYHAMHPHTHPRDVGWDARHAAAAGVIDGLLWLPTLIARAVVALAMLLVSLTVGHSTLRRHVLQARISMHEQQLATVEQPADVRDIEDLRDALDSYVARHPELPAADVAEAYRRLAQREQRLQDRYRRLSA